MAYSAAAFRLRSQCENHVKWEWQSTSKRTNGEYINNFVALFLLLSSVLLSLVTIFTQYSYLNGKREYNSEIIQITLIRYEYDTRAWASSQVNGGNGSFFLDITHKL